MSVKGIGGAPTRATTLPDDPKERKQYPVASGVLDYFPDALVAVAHVSWKGNEQHNPGKPLHWARDKSTDENDTMIRHYLQRGSRDTDGERHSAKMAWRALAILQKEIEAEQKENELDALIEKAAHADAEAIKAMTGTVDLVDLPQAVYQIVYGGRVLNHHKGPLTADTLQAQADDAYSRGYTVRALRMNHATRRECMNKIPELFPCNSSPFAPVPIEVERDYSDRVIVLDCAPNTGGKSNTFNAARKGMKL